MKLLSITILFSFFILKSYSQSKYSIHKGYSIYKDYDNKTFQIDKDLDGDKLPDRVIVYSKNNSQEDNIVAFYLSTVRVIIIFPSFSIQMLMFFL